MARCHVTPAPLAMGEKNMTWEALLAALKQIEKDDPKMLRQLVVTIDYGQDYVLLDLVVNVSGSTMMFVPDYDPEKESD